MLVRKVNAKRLNVVMICVAHMAHSQNMKVTRIHSAQRRLAGAAPKDAEPRVSMTPLSDPFAILRQLPAQAISPALLELLDIMSSPVLLINQNPAGELREMPPAKPVLARAA